MLSEEVSCVHCHQNKTNTTGLPPPVGGQAFIVNLVRGQLESQATLQTMHSSTKHLPSNLLVIPLPLLLPILHHHLILGGTGDSTGFMATATATATAGTVTVVATATATAGTVTAVATANATGIVSCIGEQQPHSYLWFSLNRAPMGKKKP